MKENEKYKFFKKHSCEKKKGEGAKPHARNKRQGGKTLMPEISVISRFGGSEAPPKSPVKKNAKNIHFLCKIQKSTFGQHLGNKCCLNMDLKVYYKIMILNTFCDNDI